MNVTLDKREMAQAKQAAALRYQLARAAGVKDALIGTNHSTEAVDLIGIKAEIAVAKLFRAEFDANTLGIDSGVDLYVKGLTKEVGLQVKSTHHPDAKWLLIDAHKDSDWDVAVLVLPTDQDEVMCLAGCISRTRCVLEQEQTDLGHGPTVGVRAEKLSPVINLWGSINA